MSEDVQSGRYYLKADVSRLWRRFRDSVSRGPSVVKAFERELLSIRRERAAVSYGPSLWTLLDDNCVWLRRQRRMSNLGITSRYVTNDKHRQNVGIGCKDTVTLKAP